MFYGFLPLFPFDDKNISNFKKLVSQYGEKDRVQIRVNSKRVMARGLVVLNYLLLDKKEGLF